MDAGFRVYLLEDSIAIREVLTSSLESNLAIQVVGHADDVGAALSDPRLALADAIIVDLSLRGGNGFQMLQRMQAESRFARMVKLVLTNYASPTYRRRALALGADHFFDKSLEFDRVIALLDRLAAEKAGKPDETRN